MPLADILAFGSAPFLKRMPVANSAQFASPARQPRPMFCAKVRSGVRPSASTGALATDSVRSMVSSAFAQSSALKLLGMEVEDCGAQSNMRMALVPSVSLPPRALPLILAVGSAPAFNNNVMTSTAITLAAHDRGVRPI